MRPCTRDMAYTSRIVAAAPMNALMESWYGPRNENVPNSMPSVAVAEAPLDTPRMYGSASELRTSACIATPVTASDAPTIMPSSTRGNRSPHTMFSCSGSQVTATRAPSPGIRCSSTRAVTDGGTLTGPRPVASTTVSAAASDSSSTMAFMFGALRSNQRNTATLRFKISPSVSRKKGPRKRLHCRGATRLRGPAFRMLLEFPLDRFCD